MALSCLSTSPEWDFPIFKVLANNDTGNAPGHQGGVVIPQDLRKFFPGLTGAISAVSPTIDHRINAQLFLENGYKGTVSTRYQFQTWGGVRSPESRLTDQLGPLRNVASGGDVLIIQRSIDRLDYYRLTLVRKTSPEFPSVNALVVGRRWGVVTRTTPPVSDDDLRSALVEEKALETTPFSLIDPAAGIVTTTVKKVARSIVFRSTIIEQYEETCAICEEALRTPAGLIEIDAAHVVPRSLMGADDARNGFALCKRHHWAFDKGLFGIGDDRKVLVPSSVSSIAQNTNLKKFHGHPIREANTSTLKVDARAFRWHLENLLVK
jgi:putative restriction endonuclease